MTEMTTTTTERLAPAPWRLIDTGESVIQVAERAALGTSARLVLWPPEQLEPVLAAVDDVLAALDLQASRFRPDSEISRIHRAGGGRFMLSDGLAEAIGVALAAARWTAGLVDPTIGKALISLGYDRDFGALEQDSDQPVGVPAPVPGWQSVELDGRVLRLPAGVRLDLGATAKGLGSDRAARAALAAVGPVGGVLISLGGDIAIAGQPPRDGWPILVADGPAPVGSAQVQTVRLGAGAVATSSITCRGWNRAGQSLHHILDPRTGLPAAGPWRTVSAAATTCAEANAAATAAIVAGEAAVEWLSSADIPARLVGRDGQVRRIGGWPEQDTGTLPAPSGRFGSYGSGGLGLPVGSLGGPDGTTLRAPATAGDA